MRRALVWVSKRTIRPPEYSVVSAARPIRCFTALNTADTGSHKRPRSRKYRRPSSPPVQGPRKLPADVFQIQSLDELEQYYKDNRSILLQSDLGQLVGRILHVAKKEHSAPGGTRNSPGRKPIRLVQDVQFFRDQVLHDIRGMLAASLSSSGESGNSSEKLIKDLGLFEATENVQGLERPVAGREVASLVLYLSLGRVQDSSLWLMLVLMTEEQATSYNGKSKVNISPTWTGAQTAQRLCYGFALAGIGSNDPKLTRILENLVKSEMEHLSPMGASQCAWGLWELGSETYGLLQDLMSHAIEDSSPKTEDGKLSQEQRKQLKTTIRGLLGHIPEKEHDVRRNLEALEANLESLSSATKVDCPDENDLDFTAVFAISSMCQPIHYPIRKSSSNKGNTDPSQSKENGAQQLPYIPNPPAFGAPAFPYRQSTDLLRIYQANREKITGTELARPLMAAVGSFRRAQRTQRPDVTELENCGELIDSIIHDVVGLARPLRLAESMSLCISICEAAGMSNGYVNQELLQTVLGSCLEVVEVMLREPSMANAVSLQQLLSFSTRLRQYHEIALPANQMSVIRDIVKRIALKSLAISLSYGIESFEWVSLPLFLRSYNAMLGVIGEANAAESEMILNMLSHALKEGNNNRLNVKDCIQLCEISARLSRSLSSVHRDSLSSILRMCKDAFFDIVSEDQPDGVQSALLSATVGKTLRDLEKAKCVASEVLSKELPLLRKKSSNIALGALVHMDQYDRLQTIEALLRSVAFTQTVTSGDEHRTRRSSIEQRLLRLVPQTLEDTGAGTDEIRLCASIIYSVSKLHADHGLDSNNMEWQAIMETMHKIRSSTDHLGASPLMISQQVFSLGQEPLMEMELVTSWCHRVYESNAESFQALSPGRLLDIWEGLTNIWERGGADSRELAIRALENTFEGIKCKSQREQPLNAAHLLRLSYYIRRLHNDSRPSDSTAGAIQLFGEECQKSIKILEGSADVESAPIQLKSYSAADRDLRDSKRVLVSFSRV